MFGCLQSAFLWSLLLIAYTSDRVLYSTVIGQYEAILKVLSDQSAEIESSRISIFLEIWIIHLMINDLIADPEVSLNRPSTLSS